MAVTTATKKKLQMNGSDISVRTSLDNITPNISNFGGDATTIINDAGKIKSQYLELPSYVDDVIEVLAIDSTAPAATNVAIGDKYINTTSVTESRTGDEGSGNKAYKGKIYTAQTAGTWNGASTSNPEKGKIYVVTTTGKIYRWGGTEMVEISQQVATTNSIDTTSPSQSAVPTEYAVAQLLSGQLDVVVAGTVAEVDLIAITGTAPTTCAKGDKYYNTDSKKIFTATAANTWGGTGEDASLGVIYKYNNQLFMRGALMPSEGDSTPDLALHPLQYKLTSATLTDGSASAPDNVVAREKDIPGFVKTCVAEAVTTSNAGTGISVTNKSTTTPFKINLSAASSSTIGGVKVSGNTSSSNGVSLVLAATGGALTISTKAADVDNTAANAYTGSIGTVKLCNNFSGFYTSLSSFAAGVNTVAVTPNGVKTWIEKLVTEGKGLEFETVNGGENNESKQLKVKLGTGLEFDGTTKAIKLSTLSGTQVAAGLSAGTGIRSVTNGTITAQLSAVDV